MVRLPVLPPDFKRPFMDWAPFRAWLRADPRAQWLRSWALAGWRAFVDQIRVEWAGSPPHRWLIARPRPRGRAASPADLRPSQPQRGRAILEGRFILDGLTLEPGQGVEPWDRPSPSRGFAEALHRMEWLPDLLAAESGTRTALSLVLGWDVVFGRWNSFSWSPPILERRVFNLACAIGALTAEAQGADTALLLDSLARQARRLLLGDGDPARATERACAAAIAGCCLAGKAGELLRGQALVRLERALPAAVLPDGGHASRSPETGLELLLDLRALDAALDQLGIPPPQPLARALDRLTAALGALVLADGRLPAMQGGEAGDPARIAAALAGAEGAAAGPSLPHSGYEILVGRSLQAIVDVGAPAAGAWSRAACAQPFGLEVLAAGRRLIVSSGWSPSAVGLDALRLTPAASTANVVDASTGYPLAGARARALGARLQGGPRQVLSLRRDSAEGAWLDGSHDGWAQAFGLTHERRLYMDPAADELRGEDALAPVQTPFAFQYHNALLLVVRFQLAPEVEASLALDQRSVILRSPGGGWRLRNDAPEVEIEPALHWADGRLHSSRQVAMRFLVRRDGTARIRWKLSAD